MHSAQAVNSESVIQAVARVTQTGQNVALVIEMVVDGGRVNGQARVRLRQARKPRLGAKDGQETNIFNLDAPVENHPHTCDGRVARGDKRVEDQDLADCRLGGELWQAGQRKWCVGWEEDTPCCSIRQAGVTPSRETGQCEGQRYCREGG